MFNIISDIAGRYNELINLIKIMPENNKIILVGDLIDRGPDSRKVVQWAMDHDVTTLKGNHEAMMIDAHESGWPETDHVLNGGRATMKSYGIYDPIDYPPSHIVWMRHLPIYFKTNDVFISHAPWHRNWELGEVHSEHWAVWNRTIPRRRSLYQVFGHNTLAEVYTDNNGEYARCIDNSGKRVLTGLTFPDKVVYEVPYEI